MLGIELPLEKKPRLRIMGRGNHGREAVERYKLKDLWCLHLYNYHAKFAIGGLEYEIKPGDLGIIPANMDIMYEFSGPSQHLFAHFEWEYSGAKWFAPALQPTGTNYETMYRLFEEAVGYFPTHPMRAEVRLWDLLWSATYQESPQIKAHPAVLETKRQIELRLHEPLLVEALAREMELSHNHLTRLFRAATGQTVKGYLTERRMAKARHLLQKSSTPIKGIAYSVGFDDLHAFNKAVRLYFGSSPRALRARN